MSVLEDLIVAIELHSVEGIRSCFENGVNPNDEFRGEPLIYELTSEYTRTPRFKDCVKAFVDFGLELEDKALLSVLLDDAETLRKILEKDSKNRLAKAHYALRLHTFVRSEFAAYLRGI